MKRKLHIRFCCPVKKYGVINDLLVLIDRPLIDTNVTRSNLLNADTRYDGDVEIFKFSLWLTVTSTDIIVNQKRELAEVIEKIDDSVCNWRDVTVLDFIVQKPKDEQKDPAIPRPKKKHRFPEHENKVIRNFKIDLAHLVRKHDIDDLINMKDFIVAHHLTYALRVLGRKGY